MCVSSFFHSLCSRLLQGAFFCTTYGQSDHTPDRGAREDQEAVKAGAPLTWPLPRAARDWRRGRGAGDDSRFGDSDVVRRTVEAQAAEAALDVMAGLSLGAVVGAQRALIQVYGEQRAVGGFTGALGAWVSRAAGPVGAQLTRPHLVHSRQQSGPGASVGLASGRKARGRQSEQKQVSSLKSLQEPKSLQRLSLERPLWVPPSGRQGLGFQDETTL